MAAATQSSATTGSPLPRTKRPLQKRGNVRRTSPGISDVSKNMIRWFSLIVILSVVLFAVIVFSSTIVRALWYSPDTEINIPVGTDVSHNPAHYPLRIRIPALGIDANVQPVGVNDKGNMATPNNFTDVGWYKYGPAPGESGSAVVAGHVNNGLGLSGVFEHLADLDVDDDIYITRTDNTTLHFVVTGKRAYPYDDVPAEIPAEIIFNPQGSIRLNLITCEGKWVKEDKTYDQRLVVFTRLASE